MGMTLMRELHPYVKVVNCNIFLSTFVYYTLVKLSDDNDDPLFSCFTNLYNNIQALNIFVPYRKKKYKM